MSDAPATDLDVCASEPIHIPGSIQPHGFLLIVDAVTMLVGQTAGEVAAKLGVGQPLGLHLRDVIGAKAAGTVTSFVQSGRVGSAFIGQITTTSGEVLDISAFRSGGVVGVELEPAAATAESALEVLGRLEAAVAAFERCASLETLCDQAAVLFRELTGFDRVMIYRFGGERRRPRPRGSSSPGHACLFEPSLSCIRHPRAGPGTLRPQPCSCDSGRMVQTGSAPPQYRGRSGDRSQ